MQSALADIHDSVESAMREGLARGDGVIAGVEPVLRHLLVNDDRDYFADDILATLRGMIADVALQLAGEDQDHSALIIALVEVPGLVSQAHALATEGQLARRLQAMHGMDLVLSPLLRALIASPSGEVAALAMQVLAAQARFVQQQRRMQWPLGELPAEIRHRALRVWRAQAGDSVVAQEAALRADYDEAATRLDLLTRLIGELDAGMVAALDVSHAGLAMFASALAHTSGQQRSLVLLSMLSPHVERLALALRAGGLPVEGIEAALLTLRPEASLPPGVARLTPECATRLLSRAAAPSDGEA